VSVFLVGGGAEPGHGQGLLAPFVAEAAARARGATPRLAVLLVGGGDRLARFLPDYERAFAEVAEVDAVELRPDRPLDEDTVARVGDAHGIVVCGGPTPDYHAALTGSDGVGKAIRGAVTDGTPYLGFSAGAMVAGDDALLGGYLVEGHEVCEEGCSEGLDDLTVRPGLGLVPFTSDVHITAAGTLGRALDLVTTGLVTSAVGLDEDTCLAVRPGGDPADGVVTGSGSAWVIRAGERGQAAVTRVPGRPVS
jgi:cyanophycinase